MSTHSSRWTVHETNCSKVYSLSLEQWPVRPLGSGVHQAAKSRHDPNFLSRVITSHESWLYNYDPGTKQQSSQRKTPFSPQLKKACQVRSNIKSMLIIFFDIRGIVYKEFVPPGQTVNENFFTARFWDDWGKMWGTNGLKCGRTETGCCTMTMHLHTPCLLWGNSWQKITWPPFPTLSTHLNWPPAISMCSLKWNSSSKGSVLYPLKRSKQNHNRY